MRPRRLCPQSEDRKSRLQHSLETGIFNWQELAHLDFEDLTELIYRKNAPQVVESNVESGQQQT